jgi:hypothetical protein
MKRTIRLYNAGNPLGGYVILNAKRSSFVECYMGRDTNVRHCHISVTKIISCLKAQEIKTAAYSTPGNDVFVVV